MSVSLATIVTLISACICLPAAYAFARLDFPVRNLLFFSFLAGHAFPKFGLLVAIAGIFLNLGLIGTFWGVVLIQLVGTLLFMIWIPVAAFQAVDRRMEEAARDVGASPLRVFWSITLPQAGPTIAAALLLSFVCTFYETEGAWLIGAPQIRTMPVLMISFINNQPVIQYGAVLSVLLWIPSFVALMFARRVIGSGSFARGFGADREPASIFGQIPAVRCANGDARRRGRACRDSDSRVPRAAMPPRAASRPARLTWPSSTSATSPRPSAPSAPSRPST